MRVIHIVIAAIGLSSTANVAASEPQVVCTISDCKEIEVTGLEFAGAPNFTTSQVWSLAGEILAVSGLAPNFQVLESGEVSNAAALMRGSERFIVFNPEWLASVANTAGSKWEVYAVLAHEIGHHLQGHTLLGIGSRPPVELEADTYAGFVLGALGASMDQAQALWRGFGEKGSPTHPPRHQRLAAVERGWTRATQRLGGQTSAPPRERDTRPLPVPTRSIERDRSADTTCVPVQTSLGQAVACVTSHLLDSQGVEHAPAQLFDQDPETTWVEDGFQFGAGESIAVEFTIPTDIRRILFRNGSSSNEARSSRIKELNVKSSAGFEGTITLQDQTDWQFVPLPLGAVEWISFTIAEAYVGDGPQDTSLAEIGFE